MLVFEHPFPHTSIITTHTVLIRVVSSIHRALH
jgi:hypothetical protein